MQKYRLKKKQQVAQGTPLTEESPYLSKSTETKATQQSFKGITKKSKKTKSCPQKPSSCPFPSSISV